MRRFAAPVLLLLAAPAAGDATPVPPTFDLAHLDRLSLRDALDAAVPEDTSAPAIPEPEVEDRPGVRFKWKLNKVRMRVPL